LVAAETARVHGDWYPRYSDLYQPKTRELIEQGLDVPEGELEDLRAGREALRTDLEQRMESDSIDLWLSPAARGPAPRGLESTGDPVMNLPWTCAGVPTLAVPAWEIDGLPVGLQIAARFQADEELLQWGAGLVEVLGR
jgi:Asp-tRNA(Asn)/Glu-tRNA(Gln) amidotransferase A subunit family amidase